MQKIFKIDRVNNSTEFKDCNQASTTRTKRARMARKNRKSVNVEKMIAAQTKLHNEEKEMLMKQGEVQTKERKNTAKSEDPETLQVLKSDSVLSVEQETRDTSNDAENDNSQEESHSKIYVTSIDAAILEGLDFIKNAPLVKQAQTDFQSQRSQLLPERTDTTPEYTLVLDLDETLVHCSISPFEGFDEIRESIYISYRPYLINFLEKVSQLFEVVVFTASEQEYASMVLNRIDPENKYIHHRLYRDSWLPLNGNYIKDLSMLGRDIDKTMIIDNSVIAFSLNIDNGIPIQSYSGNKQDDELYKLIQVIDYAFGIVSEANQVNLREYLTSIFGLKERIAFWQSRYIAHSKQMTKINTS
jgi:CTD small phosphatase-like protein 2